MKLSAQVLHAIDDGVAGRFESVLLHACIGIDATSKRLFPTETKVGTRYVNCLRNYYWIIEPMLGSGIDLEKTKFTNLSLKSSDQPDLANVIYEVFRCAHAHGDDVSINYSVIPTSGGFGAQWEIANGVLRMPDRIVWALIGVSIFSRVNKNETTDTDHYLSLGNEIFRVRDWWGWEDHFRIIAKRFNTIRVALQSLDNFVPLP